MRIPWRHPGLQLDVTMDLFHLLDFSFQQWWYEASNELMRYLDNMDTTQWMIISACGVAFGFLCLRGTTLK